MPDLALNLFVSLGEHVELSDNRSLINPLPSYVENKAGEDESVTLDEMIFVLAVSITSQGS